MKALAVFEGGGTKGLAHVGALKVAEEWRVEFAGVAGASAGAIVAALVAAGYRADELFKKGVPNSPPTGALARDLVAFLDEKRWKQWKALARRLALRRESPTQWSTYKALLKRVLVWPARVFPEGSAKTQLRIFLRVLGVWILLPFHYFFSISLVHQVVAKRGIFSLEDFEKDFERLLFEKVIESSPDKKVLFEDPNRKVHFEDLKLPLAIVATDVVNERLAIFSQSLTPTESVTQAVSSSVRIPFFLQPQVKNGVAYVDGGLLSNFPAWLFDKERRASPGKIPTFGFRLVQRQPASNDVSTFLGFARKVAAAVVSGDPQLETREVDNLYIVPLPVSVGTLDFDLSSGQKERLYSEGMEGARNFFINELGPRDQISMSENLRFIRMVMMNQLGLRVEHHLRTNITIRTPRDTLRVMYYYGMEDDADDNLEFEIGSGACSVCWTDHKYVICDLENAKIDKKWNLSKYQQALVRPTLKALLCLPVFDPQEDKNLPLIQRTIIGVLNFDSDDRSLLEKFADDDLLKYGTVLADRVAEYLRYGR